MNIRPAMNINENFLVKTFFKDWNGSGQHLYVEHYLGVNDEVFYHCIINGTDEIDIEMVDNGWEDVLKTNGRLAKELGAIIERHCK